jgi:hypothetical protein
MGRHEPYVSTAAFGCRGTFEAGARYTSMSQKSKNTAPSRDGKGQAEKRDDTGAETKPERAKRNQRPAKLNRIKSLGTWCRSYLQHKAFLAEKTREYAAIRNGEGSPREPEATSAGILQRCSRVGVDI